MMKCYRVWFTNGAACLVNAESEEAARVQVHDDPERFGCEGLKIDYLDQLYEESRQ